ncbi:hypothetical protein [uncultured Deinococcus sp.]|uniref:hypothetical protein n=1 Tax=uncultured Deinococcus sp. TaxID=158789 RepID=UPI00258C6697|nr:hypothetical protein [uncultured Deinococcus sp.]
MPILILGGGRGEQSVTVSLEATARTRPSVKVGLQAWAATRREPITVGLWATVTTLVPDIDHLTGGPVLETDSSVTGLPGDVISWSYTHSGQYEELSVVVTGQHGLALPTALVQARGIAVSADETSTPLGTLPARAFQALGQEPEVDVGGDQTTFLFRNDRDQELRGVRLPELIPWKSSPTPPGSCTSRPRQRVRVSVLVHQVMRNFVDGYFALVTDPLVNDEWIEEERDFSTLNMTPQELWDQTYGLIGMQLHIWPQGVGFKLVGRFTQPSAQASPSARVPNRWALTSGERRERRQTPTLLTVTGAPSVTPLNFTTLMALIGDDPARDEISRALGPGSEWFEESSADTGVTRHGFRKARGQLVAQVEITTGDVVAKETVDGKEVSATFSSVVLSYSSTSTVYDPDCADRPLLQRTLSRTYAYTPFSKLEAVQVAGPGIYTSAPAGDLASEEVALTTFAYSPQGWQTARTTTTTRLGSLQQQDAEEEPDKRGKLLVKERLTDITAETWLPTGAGRWQHTVQRSVQSLVPVYDRESGEAVRTSTVTRPLPPVIETTDQAPPSYRCPDDCLRDLSDPTGAVLASGDAGFGEAVTVALPWASPGSLVPLARVMLEDRWHREVHTLSLPYPLGVVPGSPLDGGWVREVSIQGSAAGVDTSVTVAAFDDLFPLPSGAQPYLLDPNSGSSLMLAGRPGGARVRLVKGWDPTSQKPITEDALVAFRTGFPPTPGDEISWTLIQGRREAQSAR